MTDPQDIARQRIAEEAEAKTGTLYLSYIDDLEKLPDEIATLSHLQTLHCSTTKVSDLKPLKDLPSLQSLDCANTEVSDLKPLKDLPSLQNLTCSGTKVSDLQPLKDLTSLQTLDCFATKVSDLKPLKDLTSLQTLNCSATKVSDLHPLKNLASLQTLHCSATKVSDLQPLKNLASLQTLHCSETKVSDLQPLKDLASLQSLHCSGTKVSDLQPLKDLASLQTLDCSETKVSDLQPLKNLASLQTLHCSWTKVSDLQPLKDLASLQSLHCYNTQVSDLQPLKDLTALQSLDCANTEVSDLKPLKDLPSLQNLTCSGTKVSDLQPLKDLTSLQTLDCFATKVSDLKPLKDLTSLQTLNCSATKVSDLHPLKNLASLQTLHCSATKVSDLQPLKNLASLQTLHCSETKVSDLQPLKDLPSLQTLHCSRCRIEHFPEQLWRSATLDKVVTYQAEIAGLPDELLSKHSGDNCLPAVRAHLDDLGDKPEPLPDVKLMILGNGRIGKTQIKNRLRDDPFEIEADSTHGISVSNALIPGTSDRFNIWDFGGQDIYFGTHMLFLKSRAVFMLVWTPESDDSATHDHQGMTFRNQPVAWWLDCIRRFSSKKSPLIVVQNQIDRDGYRGEHSALAGFQDELNFCGSVGYSACSDEGRGALDGHLKDAAKRFNPPLIGRGRLKVMRELQQRIAEDEPRSPEDKQHRLLAFEDFVALCEATGQVSNPEQFLRFLHHAGIVFWQEGLFQNQVILDQGWVLEAIYTVFHRQHCLKTLRDRQGRFTRHDLAMMIWDREGYNEDEQKLFLSFMLSSGICFEIRPASKNVEAGFVAPDHLPEAWDAADRLDRWGDAEADAARSFDYESLPPALMRNLMGRIGTRAGLKLDYWRNGFYGFERATRSKILVEQVLAEDWVGCVHIQARGPEAGRLVDRMAEALREEEQRLGLTSNEPERSSIDHQEKTAGGRPLDFAYEPSDEISYFISYAWADDTSEKAKQRADIVTAFCARAEERGITVLRDKDVMRIGDSITKFMDRLARGNRVIVILSDKYLHSPFCMYELYEIWLQARGQREEFLERIRVFTHEDAKIWTPTDRAKYIDYWADEFERSNERIKQRGIKAFTPADFEAVRYMGYFYTHIGQMLDAFADILQPSNIEELLDYSFDDPGDHRAAS